MGYIRLQLPYAEGFLKFAQIMAVGNTGLFCLIS